MNLLSAPLLIIISCVCVSVMRTLSVSRPLVLIVSVPWVRAGVVFVVSRVRFG